MKNTVPNQGVLKIADLANRRATVASEVSKPANSAPAVNNPRANMQTKIATAKLHASREIKEFREKTEEYIAYLNSTAIFPQAGILAKQILLDQFLEATIVPAINNQRIMGVPADVFNTLRRDLFKALIDKHVDNANKEGK